MIDPGLTNLHHTDVTSESAAEAIRAFIDQWTRAACGDCSPTVLDDALEDFAPAEYGPILRRIGIELAQTGQWLCDAAEEDASND